MFSDKTCYAFLLLAMVVYAGGISTKEAYIEQEG